MTVKNRGLGKGLEALFGDVEIKTGHTEEYIKKYDPANDEVAFININDIKPNSGQPRQMFNEEKIDELAASIAAHGVIQPILLKKSEIGFEIVAGERRWRAARKAGLKQIPGIIRELSKEQLMLVAIIENIQREDLNPIEEAEAFQKMCKEFGFTQEDVSKNVGKSRPYITNVLRLLKLPKKIQNMVLDGQLTNGHARTLITIEDVKKQEAIADKIVKESLSVRETEELVRKIYNTPPQKKPSPKDKAVLSIEEELKEILGTKVAIKQSGKKGRLEINYFSNEELERLIDILRALKNS